MYILQDVHVLTPSVIKLSVKTKILACGNFSKLIFYRNQHTFSEIFLGLSSPACIEE